MIIEFDGFYVNVTETNIHIHDSYKIKGRQEKLRVINTVLEKCPDAFKTRTISSVITEWRAHNILYKWNIMRDRTMHTDIEANQKLRYKIGYFIISMFGIE